MSITLTVHRGTAQIGGTCIEISHDSGARLILDAGRPLDAASDATELCPKTLDKTRAATVLICHAHQDHWGILHELPPDWQVWTGPISARLISLGYRMAKRDLAHRMSAWTYGAPFRIGPFTVTAWLTDHSAPDAAMLLVEIDGQRILYSGDFRAHGRKGGLVQAMIRKPPKDIDVLIVEGTNLGSDKPTAPEAEIEKRLVRLLDKVSGRVFVYWSAQNVDRTVSLFRAVRRRQRRLVVDLYATEVMDLVAPGTALPRVTPDFRELSLMVTRGQRRLRNRDETARLATDALIERCRSSDQAIAARYLPENAVVMMRDSLIDDFERAGIRPGPEDAFVFSSWSGYAETIAARSFDWMKQAGARIEHIHTSGHASPQDLRALVQAIAPKRIIPVHGASWHLPHLGFPGRLALADGEPYHLTDGCSPSAAADSISS